MKSRIVFFILVTIILSACRNFDPTTDSAVRSVSFCVDPTGCFKTVLLPCGTDFRLGAPDTLPAEMKMRITAYCYDDEQMLIRKQTVVNPEIAPVSIMFERLDTTRIYSCIFVQDFVQTDSADNYVSEWLQLMQQERDLFYITRLNGSDLYYRNTLLIARWEGCPSTKGDTVYPRKANFNGYLRLTNLSSIDEIDVQLASIQSSYVWSRSEKSGRLLDPIQKYTPGVQAEDILVPICLDSVSDLFRVLVRTRVVNNIDSVRRMMYDNGSLPFVYTIDCKELTINEQYYQ